MTPAVAANAHNRPEHHPVEGRVMELLLRDHNTASLDECMKLLTTVTNGVDTVKDVTVAQTQQMPSDGKLVEAVKTTVQRGTPRGKQHSLQLHGKAKPQIVPLAERDMNCQH